MSEIPELSRSEPVWNLLAKAYECMGQQKY